MFGKKWFLKEDHKGGIRPTALTCFLIILLVFGSYLFPQDKKLHSKNEPKQDILKQKDVIEAANNSFKYGLYPRIATIQTKGSMAYWIFFWQWPQTIHPRNHNKDDCL
jgi:uncharacterized membrane protein